MKKAFTLVELLVAVLLLTLLMGTALFSYRQVLLNITKAQKTTFNEILKIHQIRTSIESMQPYVIDEYNHFNQPMKKLHILFNANVQGLKYVSLNSSFSTIPSLSELRCVEDKIIFKEEPLYQHLNLNQPVFSQEHKEIIYWEEIYDCKFSYVLGENKVEVVNNEFPSFVELTFLDNDAKLHTIAISVKSDFNITASEIYGVLYDE